MKELEFPFDSEWIRANRRQLRKKLLNANTEFLEKKVAILGGSTTAGIVQMLELFLLNYGIKASFYESEYGMYYEDAVFPNRGLEEFKPDIVYIYTTNRNISEYPVISAAESDIEEMLEGQVEKFTQIWESISSKYSCPIIQNNFEMPMFRLLGNRDSYDAHGRVNYLTRINKRFNDYAQRHKDFFICDINYISADYGLREWSDLLYWYLYKYALNVNAIPDLAFNVAKIIKSIFGKNKKGLVLDLDNTLWGGVIGDDGVDNIKIGPDTPDGQVFSEFQDYLRSLRQMGVLLAIDSKNDYHNALSGLEHPESILTRDDFSEIRANWESKDRNLIDIARGLNLSLDSLVFIDDNAAERYIVSQQIPDVSTPEIGGSHQYIINIDRNGYFETTYLSVDDLRRNSMYCENAKRSMEQGKFSDYGEFLDSLEMEAEIKSFEPTYLERITQLTNKSNQFNLTTKRYSRAEIERLVENDNYMTMYGKLKDKFGDNGIVSLCIGHIVKGVCHIDLLLMSCRVLKRDMECAMLDALVKRCKDIGVKEIRGYYYPTAKNAMVKDYFKNMGFSEVKSGIDGTVWKLEIDDQYVNKNQHITVVMR